MCYSGQSYANTVKAASVGILTFGVSLKWPYEETAVWGAFVLAGAAQYQENLRYVIILLNID